MTEILETGTEIASKEVNPNNDSKIKGIFKKIITIPIDNEKNCMSAKDLKSIAEKNYFDVLVANNLDEAIKKISSHDKKLIVCLGSLYNVGNILNKN